MGEIRKIIAIGKRDSYYKDRQNIIGKLIKVKDINGLNHGSFIGIEGELIDKHPSQLISKSFYQIKLSKQRYNKKGQKI